MYEGVFDKPVQHHSMTHNQKGDGYLKVQKIDIFHMERYAYLLSRMESIKEADGTSMLHNSIVTYGAGLGDGNRGLTVAARSKPTSSHPPGHSQSSRRTPR